MGMKKAVVKEFQCCLCLSLSEPKSCGQHHTVKRIVVEGLQGEGHAEARRAGPTVIHALLAGLRKMQLVMNLPC